VLELPSGNAVGGPGQVANAMSNDPTVAAELLKYKQSGTNPQMGNLLTLPIGEELLYVQPVYTSRGSGAGSYPILQFVVVTVGDEIGIGTSFEEAFAKALSLTPTSTPEPGTEPEPPGNNGQETAAEELTRLLDDAQEPIAEPAAELAQHPVSSRSNRRRQLSRLASSAVAAR